MRIFEGMPVESLDGPCGEVVDIVVDPARRTLTHLVVRPPELRARLVPVDAVVVAEERVSLSWTHQMLVDADEVENTDFLELAAWPHLAEGWDVGVVRTLAWPYYMAAEPGGPQEVPTRTATAFDRIPAGTAELRRESPVLSRDGELLGHVDGLLLDQDFVVTHLVLKKGHLWGRREVTIPAAAVGQVETDAIRLTVGREEVGSYPSVRFHRHQG